LTLPSKSMPEDGNSNTLPQRISSAPWKMHREKWKQQRNKYISHIRNKREIKATAIDKDKALVDFYDTHDPLKVTSDEKKEYEKYLKSLTREEKKLLNAKDNYYEVTVTNKGGMVMPVILKLEFLDGSKKVIRIPAEIWRKDNDRITKVIATKKAIKHITMDPFLETADVDTKNNQWAVRGKPDYFKVKKFKRTSKKNLMQKFKK